MSQNSISNIQPDDHSRQTAEIMQRFNDVFQLHDPSALGELVAEDCHRKYGAGAGRRPPCRQRGMRCPMVGNRHPARHALRP